MKIHVDQENHGHAPYWALRSLWAAVMAQGIIDYCDARAGRVDHHRDPDCVVRTFNWLFVDEDTDTGSYLWLCELFGYDPERTRNHVRANWKKISDRARRKDCRGQADTENEDGDEGQYSAAEIQLHAGADQEAVGA